MTFQSFHSASLAASTGCPVSSAAQRVDGLTDAELALHHGFEDGNQPDGGRGFLRRHRAGLGAGLDGQPTGLSWCESLVFSAASLCYKARHVGQSMATARQ